MVDARTLELHFVDGDPDGLLTAEMFGWTGFVIRIPRLRLKDGLQMEEASHTGVYILLGEKDGALTAYVGEAESLAKRIREHDAGREWWDEALLITTSSDALHKAHVKYLESRLVEEATRAHSIAIENGNAPTRSSLNRANTANMEAFLETLFMILPALNVSIFQSGRREGSKNVKKVGAPEFVLNIPKHKIAGRARLEGADFVVLKGSISRKTWAGQFHSYKNLREKLESSGVLKVEDTHAVFTEDYAFNSPSAAAAIMTGRPANGRTDWKVSDTQKTFSEWEDEQLSK